MVFSGEDHLRVYEHENRVAILFHHSASRLSLLLTFGVVWLVLGWRFFVCFLNGEQFLISF